MQVRSYQFAVLLAALVSPTLAISAEGAEKTFDPATGNFTITYAGDDGAIHTTTFEPGNKIDVAVGSAIALRSDGTVAYEYMIRNDVSSRQGARRFSIPITSQGVDSFPPLIKSCDAPGISADALRTAKKAAKESVGSPSPWRPIVVATNPNVCRVEVKGRFSYVVDWAHFDEANLAKLQPGQSQGGFALRSRDLPGIAFGSVSGVYDLEGNEFPDNGLGNTALKDLYNDLANDVSLFQVQRPSAVPTLIVPNNPADPKLLEDIRAHVASWPNQQLMAPELWGSIDALLGQAVNALRRDDFGRGMAALAQIKGELRREFPGLQSTTYVYDPYQLAAKVLDLNIDFVRRSITSEAERPSH